MLCFLNETKTALSHRDFYKHDIFIDMKNRNESRQIVIHKDVVGPCFSRTSFLTALVGTKWVCQTVLLLLTSCQALIQLFVLSSLQTVRHIANVGRFIKF